MHANQTELIRPGECERWADTPCRGCCGNWVRRRCCDRHIDIRSHGTPAGRNSLPVALCTCIGTPRAIPPWPSCKFQSDKASDQKSFERSSSTKNTILTLTCVLASGAAPPLDRFNRMAALRICCLLFLVGVHTVRPAKSQQPAQRFTRMQRGKRRVSASRPSATAVEDEPWWLFNSVPDFNLQFTM